MSKQIKIQDTVITLEEDYTPLKDAEKDYMSLTQRAFFKADLLTLLDQVNAEIVNMDRAYEDILNDTNGADEGDMANREHEIAQRNKERERKLNLKKKILIALSNIESGTYGFCEDTGEPIGLKRLIARPFTNLCVEAQEKRDIQKKQIKMATIQELHGDSGDSEDI